MSSYGYSKTKPSIKNISTSEWCLFGMLALILIWSPFQIALFNGQISDFELKIYYGVLFTSVLSLIGIWSIIKSMFTFDNKVLLMIGVFLTPISYLLSLTMSVSKYLAVNMILIQFVYAVIFVISVLLIANRSISTLIQKIIIGTAYTIVLFGLTQWFHTTKWIGALFSWFIPVNSDGVFYTAVLETEDGLRLTSVFQYANTYAAFLMAFLFVAVFYLTTSRKLVWKLVHAFMLVPIMVSILLTLSRGGLVLLPVIFVIILLFIKPAQQIMWVGHLINSAIATFIIINPITDIGYELQKDPSASLSLKGWLYLFAASVAIALWSWVIQHFMAPWLEKQLDRFSKKKGSHALIPVGGTAIVIMLVITFISTNAKTMLPENIATRLETINFQQHSLLERFTNYKDTLKIVADYPIIGAGGGAWYSMYEKYQNNPYTTNQAHNFYLQYMTETGILGIVILMAFLIYIYWNYVRSFIHSNEENRNRYFMYFILATSILIHSAMDFNMSFMYIGILVYLCLGGMTASIESKPVLKMNPKMIRTMFASTLGIIGIGLFITSLLFVQASSSFASAKETVNKTHDFNQTMKYLKKAMDIRPTHPEYAAFEAKLYLEVYKQQKDEQFFTEAEKALMKAIADNPNHKQPLIMQLIEAYKMKGMDDNIYSVYSQNANKFPWDMNWYDEYMDFTLREGYKSISANPEKKDGYLNEVISAFEHVKARVAHLKTLPEGQKQGKPFFVTSRMAMNAGRAYFMKGEPGQAAEAMKPYLQDDLTDPNNKDLARWYVAATIQQGQIDQAWYDKLIALNPDEKNQIDQIAELKFKAE